MFNKIRVKLTLLYAVSFLLFLLLFIFILYLALTRVIENQQLEELETYFSKEEHELFEHRDNRGDITYHPGQPYFYYVYTLDRELIHGDETYEGLYDELSEIYEEEDPLENSVHNFEWEEEHFLLLKKPVQFRDDLGGYLVVGESITDQRHFLQKVMVVFLIMTGVFIILVGVLSYYLAGRAMVPIKESFDKQKKFVSDASHELRTPLSIFYSSLELLESDEDNVLSDFSQELVHDLKDESELMENLLAKLLFLARNDQQQLVLKKEEINLSALLEKIGKKFTRTFDDNDHIVFKCEITPDIEYTGDTTRLEELVYILLDNASQYTKKGWIRLELSLKGTVVRIVVEDTGNGIAESDLPHVFDRFYRADVSRKRTGTGLGLAIAKTIVEQHQGKIDVVSEEGKGTKFTVELPRKAI